MAKDKATRRALEIGRQSADNIVGVRIKALRTRTRAIAKRAARRVPARERAMEKITIPKVLRASAGSADILLAEGDSWFD